MKNKKKVDILPRKTKIILAKTSGMKATIVGHTFQLDNKIQQLFYLVQLPETQVLHPTEGDYMGLVYSTILVHPDNISTLDQHKKAMKLEEDGMTLLNLGQSDGKGYQIKTNAPEHQIEMVRFLLDKKKLKLTPHRMVKRLRKIGYKAVLVR